MIAVIQELLPYIVFSENVKDFPTWLFSKHLPQYAMTTTLLSNVQIGVPIARTRRYTILHLDTVVRLSRELCDFPLVFGRDRAPNFTWRDFLIAGKGELDAELAWACSRATSGSGGVLLSSDVPDAFETALLPWEAKHLAFFHDKARNVVYTLSQDATQRRAWGRPDICQPIISGCHLMWSDDHMRWFSGRELLLSQGFPVYDAVLGALQLDEYRGPFCSFNSSRLRVGLPSRQKHAITSQVRCSPE